jgi:tyrosinase
MSRKINITGVQTGRGPNNQTPVRMEITEFLKNADFKNLFLLGLESLMKKPQSDMKSWYQIAGIHGRPYTPWDGESGTRGKEYGYCTHSSVSDPLPLLLCCFFLKLKVLQVLFLTWYVSRQTV